MLKAWKYECNVEIKSLSLEALACAFVTQWQYRHETIFYYDWLIRDFFAFMRQYVNGSHPVPGTPERIELGDGWSSKAESASERAIRACEFERADQPLSASMKWQQIFGSAYDPPLRKISPPIFIPRLGNI
jgi:hypothetical protein